MGQTVWIYSGWFMLVLELFIVFVCLTWTDCENAWKEDVKTECYHYWCCICRFTGLYWYFYRTIYFPYRIKNIMIAKVFYEKIIHNKLLFYHSLSLSSLIQNHMWYIALLHIVYYCRMWTTTVEPVFPATCTQRPPVLNSHPSLLPWFFSSIFNLYLTATCP